MQECSERWGLELISHVAEKERTFCSVLLNQMEAVKEHFQTRVPFFFVWEAPKL